MRTVEVVEAACSAACDSLPRVCVCAALQVAGGVDLLTHLCPYPSCEKHNGIALYETIKQTQTLSIDLLLIE
eukprot:m.16365 g.16365  ORF g.16365 m.16365 type:complete len:72 (+) comp7991_c0_seq1:255-470(+)